MPSKVINKEVQGKKYRILSKNEKKAIIAEIQQNPTSETFNRLSDKYSTSVKNLRRWYAEGIDRKPGCGRKKLNESAEQELKVWIVAQSVLQGRRVRRQQLKEKAISLFNDPNFKASKAWQDEFIRNYDVKFQVNEALLKEQKLNQLQTSKFQSEKIKRERGSVESLEEKEEEILQESPSPQEKLDEVYHDYSSQQQKHKQVKMPQQISTYKIENQEHYSRMGFTSEFKLDELDNQFIIQGTPPKQEESYQYHFYNKYELYDFQDFLFFIYFTHYLLYLNHQLNSQSRLE